MDRRTGGRIGAQWRGLHGMQSEWAGILELRPKKTIAAPVYRRGDLWFYSCED